MPLSFSSPPHLTPPSPFYYPSVRPILRFQAHRSEPEMYEFQSGGVVSLLENLDEKFVAERSTLEKEELATHPPEMVFFVWKRVWNLFGI